MATVVPGEGTEVVRPAFCVVEHESHAVVTRHASGVADGELLGEVPSAEVDGHVGGRVSAYTRTAKARRLSFAELKDSIFVIFVVAMFVLTKVTFAHITKLIRNKNGMDRC